MEVVFLGRLRTLSLCRLAMPARLSSALDWGQAVQLRTLMALLSHPPTGYTAVPVSGLWPPDSSVGGNCTLGG